MVIGIDLSIFSSYQGTEVYSENLICAMLRLYPEHTYIIFKEAGVFDSIDKLAGKSTNIKLVMFKKFGSSVGRIFRQQCLLPLLVIKYRVGVLFSPSPFFSFLSPTKKISTIHDCAYAQFKEFRNVFSKIYIQTSIFLSQLLTVVVATPSEFSKQELVRLYGYVPARVLVVAGGVPVLPKVENYPADKLKRKLGIYHPYFFYIGITRPRKNLVGLLKAFYEFSLHHPNFQLVLAGKVDTTFLDLASNIVQLKLTSKVIQAGFVTNEEKVALYLGSVAAVYPSYMEGFGLPVLEAQVLGVPVLTSNNSSLSEVAGLGALYVDPYDINNIADGMSQLADNGVLRENLIQHGLANLSRFSWESSAHSLMQYIKQSLLYENTTRQ